MARPSLLAFMLLCLVCVASARTLNASIKNNKNKPNKDGPPPTNPGGDESSDLSSGPGPKGHKFKFKDYKGGAKGYLRTLNPKKVDNIVKNSYLKDKDEVAKKLDEDDDLGIYADAEALVFRCQGMVSVAQAAAAAAEEEAVAAAAASEIGAATVGGDPDAAKAFTLSSRPGSSRVIWLDFVGGPVTGTSWNSAYGSINIPAFDIDGSPASFSTPELTIITQVWRAVSEDYSMLDVDVTTIPQTTSLAGKGIRVMIGGNGAFVGSPGGIAYIGSFGKPSMGPCFAFPLNLRNNAKNIAEAVSHEVGHTLGLYHDGVAGGSAYYTGQNTATGSSWAPIMGAGYYAAVTQFDRGEYSGSNNKQDDLAVISSQEFGPRYIQSQNGNSIATATPLAVSSDPAATSVSIGTADGIVSRVAEADVFSFNAQAGQATFSVDVTTPYPSSSSERANLDAKLTIFNPDNTTLAVIDPSSLGIAATTVQLPTTGVYYAAVSGTGVSAPGTGGFTNGYSAYGSVGQFRLTVRFTAGSGGGGGGTPPPGPVNCIGSWSAWSACSAPCNGGTQTATYTIITAASNGGSACEATTGTTRSQACNTSPCSNTMRVMVAPQRVFFYSTAQTYFYCNTTVTVVDAANVPIKNAYVSGSWTISPDTTATDPYGAYPAVRSGGLSTGSSATWMPYWVPTSKVTGAKTSCTFRISAASHPSYSWDIAGSTLGASSAAL